MRWLTRLWTGRLPLSEAFWTWAVGAGLALNVAASGLALAALAADLTAWVAVVLHLAPAPVNVVLAIAVWRSAARHEGPRQWADAARLAVIAWVALLMLL